MYLLRLDDASQYWNRENWHRMHDLLKKYCIKPIVAIIPDNQDPALLKYSKDNEYEFTIPVWIKEGWIPALHGYRHCFHNAEGINPVNNISEFAGLSIEEQKSKIKKAINILHKENIHPKIFVAPAHTFDNNTIEALKQETDIRIISDTVANDIYFKNGFYYIPQQSGRVRKLPFKLTTFCYHPNTMDDTAFIELEEFIKLHRSSFGSINDIKLNKRDKTLYDKLLSFIYFHK